MQSEKNNIKILLFDLDNTLYSSSSGIMEEMDKRMYEWITQKLKLTDQMVPEWESLVTDESKLNSMRALTALSQKLGFAYWVKYGLSVNGMRHHHWNELSEEEKEKLTLDYLDYVHDVSRNLNKYIPQKDVELKKVLKDLRAKNSDELQKWIFTNSYADHANRVLEYLEIKELFHGMIDYLVMRNDCKPLPSSYNLTLKMINQQYNKIHDSQNNNNSNNQPNGKEGSAVNNSVEQVFVLPQNCIFFDDSLSNLRAAKVLGFYTVWIGQDEKTVSKPEQVDFVFQDIVSCLKNQNFLSFFNLAIE